MTTPINETLAERAIAWEVKHKNSGAVMLHHTDLSEAVRCEQRQKAARHVKEAVALVQQGVPLNLNSKSEDQPQVTVLHMAANLGMNEAIKVFLEKGADLQISSQDDMLPWMEAAAMGHKDALEMLVTRALELKQTHKGFFAKVVDKMQHFLLPTAFSVSSEEVVSTELKFPEPTVRSGDPTNGKPVVEVKSPTASTIAATKHKPSSNDH